MVTIEIQPKYIVTKYWERYYEYPSYISPIYLSISGVTAHTFNLSI